MSKQENLVLDVGSHFLVVEAKVVPFNISNSYGETLDPKAFSWDGSTTCPIPMFAKHKYNRLIGMWLRVYAKADGLYAKGIILDPVYMLGAALIPSQIKLSISYVQLGVPRTWRRKASYSYFALAVALVRMFLSMRDEAYVKKAILNEISVTNMPAFTKTWLRVLGRHRLNHKKDRVKVSRMVDRMIEIGKEKVTRVKETK